MTVLFHFPDFDSPIGSSEASSPEYNPDWITPSPKVSPGTFCALYGQGFPPPIRVTPFLPSPFRPLLESPIPGETEFVPAEDLAVEKSSPEKKRRKRKDWQLLKSDLSSVQIKNELAGYAWHQGHGHDKGLGNGVFM